VGVPAAPGLLCLTETNDPPLTRARIYRQEGTRLRPVFDAIVAAWANWLELTPLLQSDGSLLLSERTPHDCRGALQQSDEKAEYDLAPPSAQYLPDACARAGTYHYDHGKYRLDPTSLPSLDWEFDTE
jgi:hypothetical protein